MSVLATAKAGLQLDTLDEQRLKKIRDLENYQRPEKVELEPVGQKPVFITPLNRWAKLPN
jgi:titin